MSADLILTNGRFYTLDPAQPFVTAVAIRDGIIWAMGADDDMLALRGRGDWLDVNGRTATPGLVDAHVHFQNFALSLQRVNLHGTKSLADALSRITEKVNADNRPRTSDTWLQGRGWSQDDWPDRRFPTAAHLDAILPDRPAIFRDKSGHAAWVNGRALQLAGITAETADPPGGQIQRDASGQPTGILFEEAIDLVAHLIPRPTPETIVAAMRAAQTYCWQVGLTGVHDFDGRDCFTALQTLHQAGELGLRVVKNIPVYRLEHAIGVGLRTGFGDDWLRIGGVKIFADGALGPRTAAMVEPYENDPDNRGIAVTDKEEMMTKASAAAAHGLSVTVHAIGDRANHDVLDVYAALRDQEAGSKAPQLRHRIEHVQLLHPSDLHRLAKLNVIASMQPIHATSDMVMASDYWGSRTQFAYAWRTMLETGATLAFGSDAPVEPIDPLLGIHAAVTRRRRDGTPGPDGWHPEQRLTMVEAVRAFTLGTAVTSSQEHFVGTITPGKRADFTFFARDIFAMPADELPDVAVEGTMVGGIFRHRQW